MHWHHVHACLRTRVSLGPSSYVPAGIMCTPLPPRKGGPQLIRLAWS